MKAVVSQALSRLVSLGTSIPSAMVIAGALLAVLAASGSQAQAQNPTRWAAQASKPSRYQPWTQVKEYNVHYEASYSTPFSIVWDWHGSVHDYTPNMRATADGKIKMVMSNSRYTTWEGFLDINGDYAMDVNWYTPRDTLEVDYARGQGPDRSGLGMYFAMTIDCETGPRGVAIGSA